VVRLCVLSSVSIDDPGRSCAGAWSGGRASGSCSPSATDPSKTYVRTVPTLSTFDAVSRASPSFPLPRPAGVWCVESRVCLVYSYCSDLPVRQYAVVTGRMVSHGVEWRGVGPGVTRVPFISSPVDGAAHDRRTQPGRTCHVFRTQKRTSTTDITLSFCLNSLSEDA
jgi:hypothetical protein